MKWQYILVLFIYYLCILNRFVLNFNLLSFFSKVNLFAWLVLKQQFLTIKFKLNVTYYPLSLKLMVLEIV